MNQAALGELEDDETDWSVTRRFRTLPIGSWRRPKADCTDSTGGKVSCHKDQIRGPSILRVNFQNEGFIGIGGVAANPAEFAAHLRFSRISGVDAVTFTVCNFGVDGVAHIGTAHPALMTVVARIAVSSAASSALLGGYGAPGAV